MARKPIEYDFRPNALFRGGPDYHMNACVGENGGPYDLRDYGQGFFQGGRAIVAAARAGTIAVDVAIYPAAFSFRHGIELFLKAFLLELIAFTKVDQAVNRNHGIIDYMNLIVEMLSTTRADIADPEQIAQAATIIKDFDKLDPTGQVFRYPEDIKGNPHLIGINLINMEVLDEAMAKLHDYMETWIYRLRDLEDARRDGW